MRLPKGTAANAWAGLTYVLDSFQAANHTACLDSTSPYYLPEVSREQHAALRGVNSQTAEDSFVRSVVNMTPAVFEVFVTHFYNTTICASVGPSARVKAHRPVAIHMGLVSGVPETTTGRSILQLRDLLARL